MGIEAGEKKRLNNIGKFWEGKSPEEIEAIQKENRAKSVATKLAKKKAKEDLKRQAEALVPTLLAQQMLLLDNDSYTPDQKTLEKVRALLDDPKMTLEKLRRDHFRTMSEKGWSKLTSFLFKDHVSNESDLGLQILEQRNEEIVRLEKRIRMLTKEIKLAKKDKKKKGQAPLAPFGILQLLTEAERDLREYRLDVNKNIFETNLKLNKTKSPTSIHIHSHVPRPQVNSEGVVPAIDVTPQRLDDLINGD